MSKKTDLIDRLIAEVELRQPMPGEPLAGASLLEQGAVLVLLRHLTQKQAEASVEALRAAYGDWNEIRVSQVQEIASHIKTSSRKKGTELLRDLSTAAGALKEYLQDVFQQTHGLDLEILREDPSAGGKAIAELTTLGMAAGSYLLWVAGDRQVPVHTALVRLLDRLGLMTRTASMRKAREMIEPLVPKGKELAFTLALHEIVDCWNDPVEPIYMRVAILRETPAGKKAHLERLASEKREAERRKKEEARRIANEKKEEERQRREEEKERKRREAEASRKAREHERRQLAARREKERERKRREAEKKKAADKKAAERKKAAAKKAAAKKAAAKKAAAKKKGVAKKAPAKKKVTRKPVTKKPAAKKSVATKKATKKKVAKKKVTKKPATKKPATKKPATKKKVTRKPVTRKPVTRKPVTRKPVTKKPVTKKPVTKKPVTKKPGARKATSSRSVAKKKVTKTKTVKKPAVKTTRKPATRRR